MAITRKKYIVDKKFQIRISLRAMILPLLTLAIISGVVLFFAIKNNKLIKRNNGYIYQIIDNQDSMIDMFLSTPSLQNSSNPQIANGIKNFKKNIGQLKKITQNSKKITKNGKLVFYILIIMTISQAITIFGLFIFLTHKISGPIGVMTRQLRDIREDKHPNFRALRKKDELQDFYNELTETLDLLIEKNSTNKDD